ncbi:MAG: endonuclease/exonuclease/phosphatase family protein [Bacteroidales bacterium]|nr:endonuclease/exonuclease/phosphatase family protein [Bacteroidales bacterium]
MKKLICLLCAAMVAAGTFAEEMAIRVMSFNVRCVVEADGLNQWKNRKDYTVSLVRFYNPDIWGSQEDTHQQMLDLQAGLPDYDYLGVGRTDGKTGGEYSPIFYRRDRFSVDDSGYFWLAEKSKMHTPGALGWDADYPRIATWGIFTDKATGKKFFFMNTHLDHIGVEARHNGAKLLLEQAAIHAKGLPVVITGDFNAVPTDDPIKVLTDKTDPASVIDSRALAQLVYGPEGTFHDFGRIAFEQRPRLDYIFVRGAWKVMTNAVLTESQGPLFPSDHHPILADMILL